MITNTFDPSIDAIINPSEILSRIEGFPRIAVVCFSDGVIAALEEHYSPELIETLPGGHHTEIHKIVYKGQDIAVYRTAVGAPATVNSLEEMIALGCEKFVFFGSCGVLNREIAAKSLIVPTAAYRDEGTSYHYVPPSDYIEIPTASKLAEILSELELQFVCGKTWTTDACYRETRANMEKRKLDGCLTVEMECASIMAAAQFRGVKAYQFLYAADSLDEVKWDARTLGNLPQTQREQYLRIALEVAVRV